MNPDIRVTEPNRNPNAVPLLSLEYASFRRRTIRRAIRIDHEYADNPEIDVPPIHIPVTLEGVVP